MIDAKLNLARKLRAKDFDHIIGQTLSIRMLKNSLYLGHYFPVYLFSGQRGCGKTTTARVFATALNCVSLISFQKNPKKQQFPCLACDSCLAMSTGMHPDFIEMDAASHTGVDNVRQIIDAASLLPVMGGKKIYLIDEAHMLSKAAFNALLKILEEPPLHAVFILATTDSHKIIDTVKSRCFQLLFKAVEEPVLLTHLQNVCVNENIPYDTRGLSLIIQETRGSIRDALNVVEQVRFSAGTVTAQAVLSVLDHLDGDSFIHIIEFIFARNAHNMLIYLKECKLEHYSAEHVWRRFVELMRTLLWLKHGVKPYDHQEYSALERMASQCSLAQIMSVVQRIYESEELFLKTTAQHLFLEMFFVQLCGINDGNKGSSVPPQTSIASAPVALGAQEGEELVIQESDHELHDLAQKAVHNHTRLYAGHAQKAAADVIAVDLVCSEEQNTPQMLWNRLIRVEQIQGAPLVHSLLSQGVCLRIEPHTTGERVVVQFLKELSFFESVIHNERMIWHPHFQRFFSPTAVLAMEFTGVAKSVSPAEKTEKIEVVAAAHTKKESTVPQKEAQRHEVRREQRATPLRSAQSASVHGQTGDIDISDTAVWKTTHMVLHHFPGVVREVQEGL